MGNKGFVRCGKSIEEEATALTNLRGKDMSGTNQAAAEFAAYLDRNRSASPQKDTPKGKKETGPGPGTTLIVDEPRPRDEDTY